MEITGRAIAALPVRTGVSSKGQWMSREYVIETQEQYPKKICFDVFGEDKLKEFNIRENDIIKVFININAREFKGKWYNTISAWKVEHLGAAAPQTEATNTQTASPLPSSAPFTPTATPAPAQPAAIAPDDDLPF